MNTSQHYKVNTPSESSYPLVYPHHVDKAIASDCTLDLLVYLRKHYPDTYNRIAQEVFSELEIGIYNVISQTSHTPEFEQIATLAWQGGM